MELEGGVGKMGMIPAKYFCDRCKREIFTTDQMQVISIKREGKNRSEVYAEICDECFTDFTIITQKFMNGEITL